MVSSRQTLRNRLKLRQLALLAALDDAGSLHKAADRMGISQPAATRLLQDLEELMGAELFERTSRGLLPTHMGRLLIRHATMVLAGIDHVYEEALALRSGNTGSLRIGLFPGAPVTLVAQAIAQIKRATPQVDVHWVTGDNDKLLAELQDGSLSLVIGRAPPAGLASALNFELLFTDYFSVICGADNPSVPLAPKGLPELLSFPWILPVPGTAFRNSLDIQFLGQCGRLPQNLIECVSVPAIQALLTLGEYVAVVPQAVAWPLVQARQARVLMERLAGITGHVGILTRAGEARATQVSRLIEALCTTSLRLRESDDQEIGSGTSKQ